MRRVFVPKREKVTGGWRILIYAFYRTLRWSNKKNIKLTGHVAGMKFIRNLYSVLVKKPEGKRHLGSIGGRTVSK